jgi:DNA-binding CsgD family transcriptional regulator
MGDSERDRALDRDIEARARLADDPIAQIKLRRSYGNMQHFQPRVDDLSDPEKEALAYLSRGLTVRMAADAIGISPESVRSRLKRARMKLRAKNATQACCEAIRRGLIP